MQSIFRVVTEFYQSHSMEFQITGIEYETDLDDVANPQPFLFKTQPEQQQPTTTQSQYPPHCIVDTEPDGKTETHNNTNTINQLLSPPQNSPIMGSGYHDNHQQKILFPTNTSSTSVLTPNASNAADDGMNFQFLFSDISFCRIERVHHLLHEPQVPRLYSVRPQVHLRPVSESTL
jgi:hypothetical protein